MDDKKTRVSTALIDRTLEAERLIRPHVRETLVDESVRARHAVESVAIVLCGGDIAYPTLTSVLCG